MFWSFTGVHSFTRMNLPELFSVLVLPLPILGKRPVVLDLHRWIEFDAYNTPIIFNEELSVGCQDVFILDSIVPRP